MLLIGVLTFFYPRSQCCWRNAEETTHATQAATLKVGTDDQFFLLIGVFNFWLDHTGSATVFTSKLRIATLVVAVFEDIGGLATGATVDSGF